MAASGQRCGVLVAGGGIGGLTAALALSQAGQRIVVVERAAELAAIGAGLQLSPNATRVLRDLGLLDRIAAVASRPDAIRIRSARGGATLAVVPLADAERRWGAPYLVVRRADLQRVLGEAAADDPAIDLQLGTALAGFGTTDAGVEATLRRGLLARSLTADALVGADGIRSTVRARLVEGAPDDPRETGRLAWRALIDVATLDRPPQPRETGLWLGRDAHLVHYPVDGGRSLNLVAITRDAAADPEATPGATWAQPGDPDAIRRRFARWHPQARALIDAAPGWTTWPLFDRAPLPAWNAGPVALLGDAAHPILPFLAQGAAQAIEDAAALAAAVAAETTMAAAFARYSATRLVRATHVQEMSRRLGRIYHLAGPAALARNATMRMLGGHRLATRWDWLYGG